MMTVYVSEPNEKYARARKSATRDEEEINANALMTESLKSSRVSVDLSFSV